MKRLQLFESFDKGKKKLKAVVWGGKTFEVMFGTYHSGRIALYLVESGKDEATAFTICPTDDLKGHPVNGHELIFKTHHLTASVHDALVEAGYVSEPTRDLADGMYTVDLLVDPQDYKKKTTK